MKSRKHNSLFLKFVLAILFLGLLPMVILSTFIFNQMFQRYGESLRLNYEQAVSHISSSLSSVFYSYNEVSKMIYQYSDGEESSIEYGYNSYDNLRQMLNSEEDRDTSMELFLRSLQSVDSYIYAAHFIGILEDGEVFTSHFSEYSSFFRDEEEFQQNVDYQNWDQKENKLILISPHKAAYFGDDREVITLARNYFDIRGEVDQKKYVGTIYFDIDMKCIEYLLRAINFKNNEVLYIFDRNGKCFYYNQGEVTTQVLLEDHVREEVGESQLILESDYNDYGLKALLVIDEKVAFSQIRSMQKMMYVFLALTAVVLLAGAIFFSQRLTGPIRNMMTKMSQLEAGNFQIELPVHTNDEIGVLSERFNQMSQELKRYIDKSYVAQMKQSEAELTALRAQIYPHFLYNTLEIIRMTAIEQNGAGVAEMIEALAEQIRYLIGPLQDDVPLEKEIGIIKKYIYLLNCRINGKVNLRIAMNTKKKIMIPKLILQPIIENAYVHGIKPHNQQGDILIEVSAVDSGIEITVMDNGRGVSEEEIANIHLLLESDEIGIKNEYNWQSVGLKNVHDRIRHLYGENYGLKITGTLGIGTMISIVIPYREDQKDEETVE